MSINWCKFGIHDWQIVETKGSDTIWAEVRKIPLHIHSYVNRALHTKVCLKCGKIKDSIAEYKEQAKREYEAEKDRSERAKSIIKEKTHEFRK